MNLLLLQSSLMHCCKYTELRDIVQTQLALERAGFMTRSVCTGVCMPFGMREHLFWTNFSVNDLFGVLLISLSCNHCMQAIQASQAVTLSWPAKVYRLQHARLLGELFKPSQQLLWCCIFKSVCRNAMHANDVQAQTL